MDWMIKGIILGFSIAAPIGPNGLLCIRRTLAHGRAVGMATGLGAATVHALYGSIAAFGVTFIATLFIGQQMWLRLIGGAFLCYLGIRSLPAASADSAARIKEQGLGGAYLSTFLLTITNPLTIMAFAAIFAGLGITGGGDYWSASRLVLGLFLGSTLWWTILSGAVSVLRARFSLEGVRTVNRISGCIILSFGVLALLSLTG